MERKADNVIWWVMITAVGLVVTFGTAWAYSITSKVDKIAPLEINVQYIKNDIKDIKEMIKMAIQKDKFVDFK